MSDTPQNREPVASAALEPVGESPREICRHRLVVYGITIFLSAFLLFQVELIIGKYFLPWFGGSAAVWTTSMLVFQTLLFAGYAYAHAISTRLLPATQFKVHVALVVASVAFILATATMWPSPITPGGGWKPTNPDHPVTGIMVLLIASVGLPFIVLSGTAPLLQKWFTFESNRSPYRFYAVSNLGSLLGLLGYPLLVEPLLRIRMQSWCWAALYLVFAGGVAFLAVSAGKRHSNFHTEPQPAPREMATESTVVRFLLWLCLPGCASVFLLAITNMLSQEIVAVPLIWVLPLSIYLLSFTICFGKPSWYKRGSFHALYALSVPLMLMAILSRITSFQLASSVLLLFSVCMVCHGEVARLKPRVSELTLFYLTVSAGGALGGILVGVIAPVVFSGLWEFEISMLGTGLLLVIVLFLDKNSWFHTASPWLGVALVAGMFLVPLAAALAYPDADAGLRTLRYYSAALLVSLPLLLSAVVFGRGREAGGSLIRSLFGTAGPLLLFTYCFISVAVEPAGIRLGNLGFQQVMARSRNFYGVLKLAGTPNILMQAHGKTVHGFQWRNPAYQRVPTLCYVPNSGVGLAINGHPKRADGNSAPMRIGVVGMGVGTLATYGRPGDYIRFYELNPAVAEMVRGPKQRFTFLDDSLAKVDVVLGDARLSLERELARGEAQKFDILVLDAFNGDSIPVHLLTKEAFEVYLQHLSGPDAIMAIHTSAFTLDLTPVFRALMRQFAMDGTVVHVFDLKAGLGSSWVLLSRNPAVLNTPGLLHYGRRLSAESGKSILWTDDFSNLAGVLRLKPVKVTFYDDGRVDLQ